MEKLVELAQKYFSFLEQYGYTYVEENDKETISFVGKNNRMELIYSRVEYELSCHFVNDTKNTFTLQDGLNYAQIKSFKGLYQIPTKEKVEKGIINMADAVKTLLAEIDISDNFNFQKIYQYTLDMQIKLMEEYYYKIDMKKAEESWDKGNYSEVRELYEKHIGALSKAQIKKLQYIIKNS